ncbi:uncharacterized protein ColSpa_07987 [Colletotrichum spaethianum]|uniref:Uncharacterized protein n=1 Tax=Colletotrichum spaethianum TaxID=700344 RepID=A0AA37UJD7_9PEZI|nr:uncharacterized protein ColSpa_07987 [Colletotrichum spaethianum]GKT47806.1 hypothetical protein ColSpa_07987 [Colletotrichum spaethianum]
MEINESRGATCVCIPFDLGEAQFDYTVTEDTGDTADTAVHRDSKDRVNPENTQQILSDPGYLRNAVWQLTPPCEPRGLHRAPWPPLSSVRADHLPHTTRVKNDTSHNAFSVVHLGFSIRRN